MDHLVAGRHLKLILNWLPLTEAQLEANRGEVEAEYQEVLKTAAEIRNSLLKQPNEN